MQRGVVYLEQTNHHGMAPFAGSDEATHTCTPGLHAVTSLLLSCCMVFSDASLPLSRATSKPKAKQCSGAVMTVTDHHKTT